MIEYTPDKIVKHLEWFNHEIDIMEDVSGYVYQILFPGDMLMESEDGLFYSSIEIALESAIVDICEGDKELERELKLSLLLNL
jgi:hypothetical protein